MELPVPVDRRSAASDQSGSFANCRSRFRTRIFWLKTLTTIVPSASDRPVKRKIIFKKRVLLQSQCDLVLITFKTPFIFLLAHMAWWTCCTIPIKSEIFPNDIRTGENYFWKREMRNGKIVIQKQPLQQNQKTTAAAHRRFRWTFTWWITIMIAAASVATFVFLYHRYKRFIAEHFIFLALPIAIDE